MRGSLIRIRGYLLAASAGALLVAAPAAGQSSQTCEFALLGWISTQLELREARRAQRACTDEQRTACTAEQGRVRALELRLRLLRNYVDGYCRR
ncbi:MAG TPA: hypothetical protein VFO69_01465 [Allosphingosinicella sp.]|nr:hypothetical protein [Allosphingosinicella sp.]